MPGMLYNDIAETLVLDGTWQFSPSEGGPWAEITVPGCWEAQGYPKTLEGPVSYRRSMRLPAHWTRHRVQLELDAASYACAVNCNGIGVGDHRGMWTPFAFDLTGIAQAGKESEIEIFLVKPGSRHPVRQSLAGFLPDLATTFGGLWQPVRLRALRAGFEDVFLQGNYETDTIHIRSTARLFDRISDGLQWYVIIEFAGQTVAVLQVPFDPETGLLDVQLPVEETRRWSIDRPDLYTVCISLKDGEDCLAQVTRRVGFRRLSTQGSQLLFNGQPFLARGVLSWGWQPGRIAPYYTLDEARDEIRQVKAMGFNLLKLCLFVPNAAYFQAADEEGLLLWVEYPLWLPEVTPDLRAHAPREYAALTRLLREHPSVGLYSLGCELNHTVDRRLLEQLDEAVRSRISGALVCDNSGSGESYGGLDVDLADFTDYHPYYDLQFFEPLLDHWRRDWQPPRPWIFGEFCDSDTFRDPAGLIAAHGGERPWWMTVDNPVTTWREEGRALVQQQQRLEQAAPGFTPETIQTVSYAQAFLIRKYTLESLRRRAGMGGYVITGLRDTPISTSGIWDDLGRAKWSTDDFQTINGPDLLCLDVDRRRTWRHGGDRPDPLDLFNFWSASAARWRVILHCAEADFPAIGYLRWDLAGPDGKPLAWHSQRFVERVHAGIPVEIGTIDCALPAIEQATELRLTVKLKSGGRVVTNSWPVWVYPAPGQPPGGLAVVDPLGLLEHVGGWLSGIRHWSSAAEAAAGGANTIVTAGWDADLRAFTEAGGHVVLLQQGGGPLPTRRMPFWREAIKLFTQHRLWQYFPHQGYTDMQFFGLAADRAFDTQKLAAALPEAVIQPVLRRLDARAFDMAEYVFEARIGKGCLLATTLRLQGGFGAQASGPRRNITGQALLWALILSCHSGDVVC